MDTLVKLVLLASPEYECSKADLVAFGMGESLMPPSGLEWLILIGLALGVQIGGQGSVAFGLGRVPAPVASIIILIQPVVSAIAGWVMFGEALVATAAGLLVALPAIAFFNLFQRLIRARLGRAEALSRDALAELGSRLAPEGAE